MHDRPLALLHAALIVLVGGLVYWNGLHGPFIFDDRLSVLDNTPLKEWWRMTALLVPERELPVAGRPLVNLSFALNYALGGLDVVGYHCWNVAVHLACGVALYALIRQLLGTPVLRGRFDERPAGLALAAALIWTVHPLNSEVANYITQRTESMMALAYLLTMNASVRALSSPRRAAWQAIGVGCCAIGMACKESMVTAPLMVMLFDRVFVFGSWREGISKRAVFYGMLAATWIVLVVVLWSGPRVHSAGFSAGVSPWTYLLNQASMITLYLERVVWPSALIAAYGTPVSLTLADVLPQALLVLALLAVTIALLARHSPWGYGGAWFFATLAPTSSFLPIATEVGAERRMYLPLMALIVVAVLGGVLALQAIAHRVRAGRSALASGWLAVVLVALIVGALSARTIARNRDYESGLTLARTSVDNYPTPAGRHLLAVQLIFAGQHTAAIDELRRALPGEPRAHFTLGAELFGQGSFEQAIQEFQIYLRDQPASLEAIAARQVLGQAFAKQQRWDLAVEQYRMVLSMHPSSADQADAERFLGDALSGKQAFAEAIDHYRASLAIEPGNLTAWTSLGVALLSSGRTDEGVAALRRAVEIDPRNGVAQRNLATAAYDARDLATAAEHAEQAVALRPTDPVAHDLLGRTLALRGRLDEARAHFTEAIRLDPDYRQAIDDRQKLERLAAAGR